MSLFLGVDWHVCDYCDYLEVKRRETFQMYLEEFQSVEERLQRDTEFSEIRKKPQKRNDQEAKGKYKSIKVNAA